MGAGVKVVSKPPRELWSHKILGLKVEDAHIKIGKFQKLERILQKWKNNPTCIF